MLAIYDGIRLNDMFDVRKEKKMLGVILLGESNSGKSTMGKAVAEILGMRYISSGDIARKMQDCQDALNNGELAPELQMREEILATINGDDKPFILDGFPRFYEQYEWLNTSTSYEFVYIYIDVPHEQVVERALKRNRADDASIEQKFEFYKKHTLPMIEEIMAVEDNTHIIVNTDDIDINRSIRRMSGIVEGHLC